MPKTEEPEIIINSLYVENFRGLRLLDAQFKPGGAIFQGQNGEGKTAALEAIKAIFETAGAGPDAIHLDADRYTIRLDFARAGEQMTAKRVTRRTGKGGTSLDLARADGTSVPQAKGQLRAMFGERSLDALALYTAKPEDRRKMILAATDCKLTQEALNRWCETDQQWNTDGHGQEVLARVRQMYFERRTKAGQELDQAKARAKLAEEAAAGLHVEQPETIAPDAARTHVAAAERELAVLADRRTQAAQREEAAAGQRAKIAELRAKAEEKVTSQEAVAPSEDEVAATVRAEQEAVAEVARLEALLEVARATLADRAKAAAAVLAHKSQAEKTMAEATALLAQADELEAALSINTLDGDGDPIALQAAAAEQALEEAKALVARAEASAKWRDAHKAADDTAAAALAAKATWEQLDRIVKRLTTGAPAELADASDGIPGLEITPDAIVFDGKNIDLLCGAEKIRLAIAIAKRAAGGAKVLLVDGLEQLAPALLPEFVRECLVGGWSLFGTRVADGEMSIIDCFRLAGQ